MTIRSVSCPPLSALVLALTLGGLVGPAHGACPPPGECSAPGRGAARTDCIVEYDGIVLNDPPLSPRRASCVDGDIACDVDGIPNGACRFRVAACLNNPDPRFPECPPAGSGAVTAFALKNRPVGHPRFDPGIDALATAVTGLLPAAAPGCTGFHEVVVPMRKSGGLFRRGRKRLRSIATTADGTEDHDRVMLVCEPSADFAGPEAGFARARVITLPGELIEGPLARGRLGDVLMVNDRIQVVIQQPGRVMFGIGAYGGNIIDADLNRIEGERDNFEEWAPGINIENTANHTSVVVLNDGTNGMPAVVRATGPDDLLDLVNPSTVVADFGFMFPVDADDRDLPVEVQTDYVLEAGKPWVRVETTLTDLGGTALPIFFTDYLGGSGQVEMFQTGYGFGEPLVTNPCAAAGFAPCTAGSCDLCSLIAWSGEDGAAGVSYGYIHAENNSTSFSTSGVAVPILGQTAVLVLLGVGTPNFTVPALGSLTITRYFAVGDGSVGAISDIRNTIRGVTNLGTLTGKVTADGKPLADADVAVIGSTASGPGTSRNVVDHFRTGADGTYRGTLPAGTYTVRANRDGHTFGTPDPATVVIAAGATTTQKFVLPAAGRLRVTVTDEGGAPIPAKVQLVGFDPSPDPLSTQSIFGVVNNTTGVFGEQREDGLAYGIALVAFADRTGDTGEVDAEPGTYQVAVSHGPRYSAATAPVTITAGATTTVPVQLARVIATPDVVSGDFHVHSIDSPDSEVSREERVATMLAEGMDFFTPSDHDFRADFTPTIAAMGVSDLIATAPGVEITTFDYGHFNSWPVTVDPLVFDGGGIDWGRAGVPPGEDFPSFGNYGLSPAEIFAEAHADPRMNLVQINHVASFFGAGGLDIDTAEGGIGPPTSHASAASRRLDPGVSNFFDDGFDALEVWIGTDGRSGNLNTFLGLNMGDWFNLLNQGILRTGVATSDTHQRRTTQINARTYMASDVTDPGLLAAEAEDLAAAVVGGKAIGTNAPFVTVTAEATSTGQTAGLGLGDATMLSTSDGKVDVTVTVRSPLWAEFDEIEFYVNNAPQAYDHDASALTRDRYRVIPDFSRVKDTHFTVTEMDDFPAIPGARHLETSYTLNLTGLVDDSWIVVVVRGNDGVSRPLFPFLPNSLQQAGNTTLANLTDGNLNEQGVLALAFTNPLYVDADNDSMWTPPGVMLTP
jgi:hypothetical protein